MGKSERVRERWRYTKRERDRGIKRERKSDRERDREIERDGETEREKKWKQIQHGYKLVGCAHHISFEKSILTHTHAQKRSYQ